MDALKAGITINNEPVTLESLVKNSGTAWDETEWEFPKGRRNHNEKDVDCAFWQWNDVWLSSAFRSFDIREECRQIDGPVLAMQGRQDAYGTLQQIQDIAPIGAIERQVIENCGHSPHRDQPDETLAYVTAFLADKA